MAKSIASINSLLVSIKTVNGALLVKLQQLGFDCNLSLGAEHEYTIKTLLLAIDNLSIQFLTITAKRNQFIQRTSFKERKDIESSLHGLHHCLLKTQQELTEFDPVNSTCNETLALAFTAHSGERRNLSLLDATHYVELVKPYARMLETVIAQERIHALSAVLETLLSKENSKQVEQDNELTDEQTSALELSQYLIRQAL